MITDLVAQGNLVDRTAELLITDDTWKILYRNNVLDFSEEQWAKWSMLYQEEPVGEDGLSWEIADKAEGKYYNVRTFPDTSKGERRFVHHIYDVSDFADIFRELTSYSSEWRTLAACQDELISSLSDDPCRCLPIAIKYFDVPYAVLYLEVGGEVFRYFREKDDPKVQVKSVSKIDFEVESGNAVDLPGLPDAFHVCCCSGCALGFVGYGMFLPIPDEKAHRLHMRLYNEFKLYIENALMQKQIIYESEHDHMTGLFNKGKFLELKRTTFLTCDSIAVFNLDVNYLKRVNDAMGHEAGNAMIGKAGMSIKAISNDHVYGFRVGGDEFLVIAVNVSEEETQEILRTWREKLEKLNQETEPPECIVACGLCRAEAPYELDQVMEKADGLMYEDKRRIKIARGDDPDQR